MSTADTAAVGPRLWSPEGLVHQPRLDRLRDGAGAALGYAPASTPWTRVETALPPEIDAGSATATGAPSPAAAMHRLASHRGWDAMVGTEAWEITVRVLRADEASAEAVLMLWGLQDDAVAGQDLRAALRRTDAGAWVATELQERYHCARGVSSDGLCQ